MLDNTYAAFSPVTHRINTNASTQNSAVALRNPLSATSSAWGNATFTISNQRFIRIEFRISLHGRSNPDIITFSGGKLSECGLTSVYIWVNDEWELLDKINNTESEIHKWTLSAEQIKGISGDFIYITFRHISSTGDDVNNLITTNTNGTPFTISKIINTANTSPNTYTLRHPRPISQLNITSTWNIHTINPEYFTYTDIGNSSGFSSGNSRYGVRMIRVPLHGRAAPDKIIFRGRAANLTFIPRAFLWTKGEWVLLGEINATSNTDFVWYLTAEQSSGIRDEIGFLYIGFAWGSNTTLTTTAVLSDTSFLLIEKERDTSVSKPDIVVGELPNGVLNNYYNNFISSVGVRPIEFSVVSGYLPDGIELSIDGVLSGASTEIGTFTFTIRASNTHGYDEREFSLTIVGQSITHLSPRNLTPAMAGNEYNVQLEASGESGVLSATYSFRSGNLPPGLSLSSCGIISGIPLSDGTFFFIVRVENSSGYVDFTRSITVTELPNIITNSMANGTINKLYSQNINITGTTPVSLSIENRALPEGLSLRQINGDDVERHQIYGTPTEKGSFRFTLRATNVVGHTLRDFTINVLEIPDFNADYFRKINNTYQSNSRQESDLHVANRHFDARFADSIGFHVVERNGEPLEVLIERNTDRNNHIKKIKTRNRDIINVGDYINWDGHVWLIMGIDPDNKLHNHGIMFLCNLKLRWQNAKGEIIERWGYTEDFTKYSRGINEGRQMTTGDYQYGITFPVDDETKMLKRERRFAIDFEGIYPPDVYRVTNRKIYQNDNRYFDRGGILTLALSFDFFNPERDKLFTLPSGEEVWICGLHSPTESTDEETSDVVVRNNQFDNWWKQGGDNNK